LNPVLPERNKQQHSSKKLLYLCAAAIEPLCVFVMMSSRFLGFLTGERKLIFCFLTGERILVLNVIHQYFFFLVGFLASWNLFPLRV
jgi:hypothetical protein